MNRYLIKRGVWATLVLLIIYGVIYSLPLPKGVIGDYNPFLKRIRCFDPNTCLHEIGHKIDHEQSWISKSDEWVATVKAYLDIQGGVSLQNGIREMIMLAPDTHLWRTRDQRGGHLELYASILMYSKGDPTQMPEQFVEFYNWDRIWELQKEIMQ